MTDVSLKSDQPTIIGSGATALSDRYRMVRQRTDELAEPLSPEDQVVQSMPDCSPTKWHRAHTTWFFEEFVLSQIDGYEPVDPSYRYLFNSYYEAVGPRQPRPRRGMITRPSVAEVAEYRRRVDESMTALLADEGPQVSQSRASLIELGTHHEQQHQELLLMDIKYTLFQNPLRPAYELAVPGEARSTSAAPVDFTAHDGGLIEIGHDGAGFAFDNEGPRHKAWLDPFALADRLVTCGEWLAFMADNGYSRPGLWLSDGWAAVQSGQWDAPLYWDHDGNTWTVFTLGGVRPVRAEESVVNISYYEADAYARWAGCRLPSETEWEVAAAGRETNTTFALHPRVGSGEALDQLFGEVWQWTASPYTPYPGFKVADGAVGEYNGKFMVDQQVLRGGACITAPGHTRSTYRNFFPTSARWAFSGLRLATDA